MMQDRADAPAAPHSTATLPPRALAYAIAAQLPLVAASWPPSLSTSGVATAIALVASAAVLNVWSDVLFRRKAVGVCPFSDASALVIAGPFRATRNPMYVGLVMVAAAPVALTGVIANAWAPVALAMWLHFRYVLPEEAFLRRRFGAPFDAYCARVPRWIGLPSRGVSAPFG